ncbi:MAG: hypothetical protein KGJ13_02030 [Patescibacteria group bacterium]|nr:hypothetical protein [Patescibacteria group bacterium]
MKQRVINLKLLPPGSLALGASKLKSLRAPYTAGVGKRYMEMRLLRLDGAALLALADALSEMGFDPDSEFTRCGLWVTKH